MAHRIGRSERIAPALMRLVDDDLRAIAADLAGQSATGRHIHRARQRLKRTRAILRVLEPPFGKRVRAARRQLAATARMLAGSRDAEVVAGAAAEAGFSKAAKSLGKSARRNHRGSDLGKVAGRIRQVRRSIRDLEPDPGGRTVLEAGISDCYRRGRSAMLRAHASGSVEDLHAWRKEVKQLYYLLRISRRRVAGVQGRLSRRLERLGDLLGEDHDYALLASRLEEAGSRGGKLRRQCALIADRRRALAKMAFRQGERIYRLRPDSFANNLIVRKREG